MLLASLSLFSLMVSVVFFIIVVAALISDVIRQRIIMRNYMSRASEMQPDATETQPRSTQSTQNGTSNSVTSRKPLGAVKMVTLWAAVSIIIVGGVSGWTGSWIQASSKPAYITNPSPADRYIEVGCPKRDPKDCKPEEMVRVVQEYPKYKDVRRFKFEYLNKSGEVPYFNIPFCAGSRIPFRVTDVLILMKYRYVQSEQCNVLADEDDTSWVIKVNEKAGMTDSEMAGIQ